MSQTAANIPKGLWSIHISDFWKSLFLAAIANILMTLYPIINGGHWPTSTDLQAMLKSTVAIILAYLIKNMTTNNVGQILKKDKPVISVNAETLQPVQNKNQ